MNRRQFTMLAVLAPGAIAACGSKDERDSSTSRTDRSTPDTQGSAPATTAADITTPSEISAFPVTVSHAFGSTMIAAAPVRVVSLGYGDEDALVSLGVVPVGAVLSGEAGFNPWYTDVDGTQTTEPIDVTDGWPYEQIAALDPDVIIALGSGVTEEEYRLLTDIAATIPYQTEAFLDPWQGVTATIGEVLGRRADADCVVRDTERMVGDAAAAHPEWAGLTFVVAVVISTDEIGLLVAPEENTVRLLSDLGMTLAPDVAALQPDGTTFSVFVSREQIALLDADVLLLRAGDETVRAALESDSLFQSLGVVGRGDHVWTDGDLWISFRTPSALAIPYALEHLTPELESLSVTAG